MIQKIINFFRDMRIASWYEKYEVHISSFALLAGFAIDNLSLGRIDALADSLILTVYISLAAVCIVVLAILEKKSEVRTLPNRRLHFGAAFVLQFVLGGIFSAFFVFFSRSATLEASWPFLLLLLTYLIGNEVFKKHYDRVSIRLGVYFFALCVYCITLTPVLFKSIETYVFIISCVIAVLLFALLLMLLNVIDRRVFVNERRTLTCFVAGVLFILNISYFYNIIPPLPLSLRDSGIYHKLTPMGQGGYIGQEELSSHWFDFLASKKVFHRYNSEPVYVFTAVYSPVDLNTTVVHNWQRWDTLSKAWVTESDVKVPIQGGRQDGYRLYSLKQSMIPGLWRVNVITEEGRLIGRLKFVVENVDKEPLKQIIKK